MTNVKFVICRNTKYARDFLEEWANYEDQIPDSYNGRDNGALHVGVHFSFVWNGFHFWFSGRPIAPKKQ